MKRGVGGDAIAIGAVAIATLAANALRKADPLQGSRDHDATGDQVERMAQSNLRAIHEDAERSMRRIQEGGEVPAWAADRITRAEQHLGDVSNYLEGRAQAGSRALPIEELIRMTGAHKAAAPVVAPRPELQAPRREATSQVSLAPMREPRSPLADELISVDDHEASWSPTWISTGPIPGYKGTGPILLIGLRKESNFYDRYGRGHLVAPGYPALTDRKRLHPFDVVSSVRSSEWPVVKPRYKPDMKSLYVNYPMDKSDRKAPAAARELAEILRTANGGNAPIAALQAVAMVLRSNSSRSYSSINAQERSAMESLGEALWSYMERSGIKEPPAWLARYRPAVPLTVNVARTFEESPRFLSMKDPLFAEIMKEAMRDLGAMVWRPKAEGVFEDSAPHQTTSLYGEPYVAAKAYAISRTAAEWVADHTPYGRVRAKSLGRPWALKLNQMDALDKVMAGSPRSEELRLVGTLDQDENRYLIFANKREEEVHINREWIAILLAAAAQGDLSRPQLRLEAGGSKLSPVFVEDQTRPTSWGYSMVVMPVRLDR